MCRWTGEGDAVMNVCAYRDATCLFLAMRDLNAEPHLIAPGIPAAEPEGRRERHAQATHWAPLPPEPDDRVAPTSPLRLWNAQLKFGAQ